MDPGVWLRNGTLSSIWGDQPVPLCHHHPNTSCITIPIEAENGDKVYICDANLPHLLLDKGVYWPIPSMSLVRFVRYAVLGMGDPVTEATWPEVNAWYALYTNRLYVEPPPVFHQYAKWCRTQVREWWFRPHDRPHSGFKITDALIYIKRGGCWSHKFGDGHLAALVQCPEMSGLSCHQLTRFTRDARRLDVLIRVWITARTQLGLLAEINITNWRQPERVELPRSRCRDIAQFIRSYPAHVDVMYMLHNNICSSDSEEEAEIEPYVPPPPALEATPQESPEKPAPISPSTLLGIQARTPSPLPPTPAATPPSLGMGRGNGVKRRLFDE